VLSSVEELEGLLCPLEVVCNDGAAAITSRAADSLDEGTCGVKGKTEAGVVDKAKVPEVPVTSGSKRSSSRLTVSST
jgi:hypothetical protein